MELLDFSAVPELLHLGLIETTRTSEIAALLLRRYSSSLESLYLHRVPDDDAAPEFTTLHLPRLRTLKLHPHSMPFQHGDGHVRTGPLDLAAFVGRHASQLTSLSVVGCGDAEAVALLFTLPFPRLCGLEVTDVSGMCAILLAVFEHSPHLTRSIRR